AVGFTALPSVKVSPPRIAEAPVQMECQLMQIVDIGQRHHVIIGEVVWFHYRDDLVNERFHVDLEKLKPVGRLSGQLYSRVADTFALKRKYLNNAIPRS